MNIKIIGKASSEKSNIIWFELDNEEYGINEDFGVDSLQCGGSSLKIDAESIVFYSAIVESVSEKVNALGGSEKIEFI